MSSSTNDTNTRLRCIWSRAGAFDHIRLDRGSRKLRKHGRSLVYRGVVVPERRELGVGCENGCDANEGSKGGQLRCSRSEKRG